MKILATILLLLITLSCSNPFHRIIDDIDSEFNYNTSNEIFFEIDTIHPNAPVELFYNSQKRLTAISDKDGLISGTTTLPAYITEIELRSNYLGLPQSITVPVKNRRIKYKYFSTDSNRTMNLSIATSRGNHQDNYETLGNWNSSGVPDYIIETETLTTEFLTLLNSILPEQLPVPEHNPQYLTDSAITNINVIEDGEVFVTFIHEGAGYKNTLLFFTYNTIDGPPSSVDKEDLTIIYPNVSFSGSGGGLISGDKVKIGEFTAGTTIAWALIANGFSSNATVGDGLNTFYSIDELNVEDAPYNQHVVQIAFDERVVISFEDLVRPGGDNDFNDAIFSVSSNPITAIDTEGILVPDDSSTIDTDGDGVIDTLDAFPNDSNIASIQYYPSEGNYGTLAYEDLWPHMGDYDFNDLVIDIRIEEYTSASGDIVSIKGWFLIQGILASMNNGFAIELGLSPDKVLNTTGGDFSRGYIIRESNGTEERQSKAVIGIFEEADRHYTNNLGTELEVTVEFTEAVSRNSLGYPPYNPFLMSNGERGREVHLPGKSPTDLVHADYFKTVDDNTTVANGNTYKTSSNRPWVLDLPVSFSYPIDDVEINLVYHNYDNWVNSSGESNSDWYLDLNGYIDHSLLFVK